MKLWSQEKTENCHNIWNYEKIINLCFYEETWRRRCFLVFLLVRKWQAVVVKQGELHSLKDQQKPHSGSQRVILLKYLVDFHEKGTSLFYFTVNQYPNLFFATANLLVLYWGKRFALG